MAYNPPLPAVCSRTRRLRGAQAYSLFAVVHNPPLPVMCSRTRRLRGTQAYSLFAVHNPPLPVVCSRIRRLRGAQVYSLFAVAHNHRFQRYIVTFVACAAYKYNRRLRGVQKEFL